MSLLYVLSSFTFLLYFKFFMFTLFLLYLVRNDNNKDDQSYDNKMLSSQ